MTNNPYTFYSLGLDELYVQRVKSGMYAIFCNQKRYNSKEFFSAEKAQAELCRLAKEYGWRNA